MSQTPFSGSWSELASWYDEVRTRGSGTHETALATTLEFVPELARDAVIDVACGQGLATRALLEYGAGSVTGVDAAGAMIEIAKRRTSSSARVSWRVDDAERLETCENAAFDGAVCQLALMDIADLDACLSAIHRVLKQGGWFVFVIGHPCFLAPDATTEQDQDGRDGRLISRYFKSEFWHSSNPNGVRGRAGNFHRPLSSYLNALIGAGFELQACLEPRAERLLAQQQPVYLNVPIFFAARARKH